MPVRPWSRTQHWELPLSLDDWVAADHPVRFLAADVDELTEADWATGGVRPVKATGAPAYDPRLLLAAWLYGFMTGVRSARGLETACRDRLPFQWLTGRQTPDHNTLWRFDAAHRAGMRALLRHTVRTAVAAGLVEWAVLAIDGTKIAGNAAKARSLDEEGLSKLLARTEAAIAELDARHAGDDPPPPSLPAELAGAEAVRTRVAEARARVAAEDGPARVNLTDPDAALVKSRQGVVAGDNAQAAVVALDPQVAGRPGRLIAAAEVVTDPDDHGRLLPMLAAAAATLGRTAAAAVADGGDHAGANVTGCAVQGHTIARPEAQQQALDHPDHKDAFADDAERDADPCPQGHLLTFRGVTQRTDRPLMRVDRGLATVCRARPLFGECTTDRRPGRALEVGPSEATQRTHRAWMATADAKTPDRRRQGLIEPVFGGLKERQGARRFLLRGLAAVRAEWSLLATAANLRTLGRVWRGSAVDRRAALVGARLG